MRVLQINSGHLFGGIESLQLTLARERHLCPDLEFEYGLCFDGKPKAELLRSGVIVHDLGSIRARHPWQIVKARTHLLQVLLARSFDAVICHGSWSLAMFAPAIQRAKLPVILWLHDPLTGRFDWLSWWAQRTKPDLIICNSQYTKRGLHHLYCPERTRHAVLYCPVSPPPPQISEVERLAMRASFNTAADACVTLQISRLDPHKGHLLHLEALAKLRDIPNWVCWQVAGPQRPHEVAFLERIKATAERLGISDRIRFLGWQPDIWKLMRAADLFCQPNSAPEPFGLTYVEALWSRLPVVATAMGGALEIVTPQCGVLTPPGDTLALSDALRRLIADPEERRRLAAGGPARAQALCSPADHLIKLRNELKDLCGVAVTSNLRSATAV